MKRLQTFYSEREPSILGGGFILLLIVLWELTPRLVPLSQGFSLFFTTPWKVVEACYQLLVENKIQEHFYVSSVEFLAGLAVKLVDVQGASGDPAVQATLGGDIATVAATFDALVHAAERFPLVKDGVARPHPRYIYAGMSLQRRLVVDLMKTLRELAGGAFQAVPSSEDAFTSPETRADTERYYRSATVPSRERIKLIKLIWDFVGTEFAGRQLQYEMFYSASQPVVNRRMYRSYDWDAVRAVVDRCLGEY